ncbi:MAG: hypothetical protein K0R57_6100 [Paenibacillaceae bacterium]|jgi:hypothetical protein|nr:hypothetical protein [Paenibacillaceae bacterium]
MSLYSFIIHKRKEANIHDRNNKITCCEKN